MSMMLIIFGPLVMMVFQYKRNPGSLNGGRARGSVFITGTSSHHETGSFYSGYNGSGRTGGSLRRSQPFAGMRNSKRHSFAGQDDKTLKEMVAIVASKELGISGSGNGSGNASASSLGDSFNASKPFEVPVHPVERFQDEESSNANLEADYSRKRVSDIIEESESVCSASIASSIQVLASRPLLEDLADSIASIKCPEQDVTPQMLLLDLVPRSTAQKMLDESESTVPFCGGDFLSDNLLGDDSDSSVPFQGSNHDLDDGSAVSGEPMDGSSRRSRGKGRVSDSEVPPLTKEEIPSNETSATDLSRSASSYSQHLLQSSCSEHAQSQRGHVTVAVSYHNSDSSSKQEDVFERDAGKPVATKPVIATIENRTSRKEKEIPFSSRFVDYKNRLSSLRSEYGTLSTIDSPTRESRPADSITKMNDSLVQVQDESNGSGVDRRGSFQMMNDYIVQSLRDVSDHESSSRDRLDHSGTRRQNDRKSSSRRMNDRVSTGKMMKDRSFLTGAPSRKMSEQSDPGIKDRSLLTGSSGEMSYRSDPGMRDGSGGFISRLTSDRSGGRSSGSKAKGVHTHGTQDASSGGIKESRPGSDANDQTRYPSGEGNSRSEDDLYPWEKHGEVSTARDLLGYDVPNVWQGIAGSPAPSDKKNGVIKGTISALHQSMSAFQFSPDIPGNKKSLSTKLKNPFAGLNLSVPALHYTHGSREDDDDDNDEESHAVSSLDLDENHYETLRNVAGTIEAARQGALNGGELAVQQRRVRPWVKHNSA
ncbi:expressed unknown protein [Seminavis robusta]|uniref:Uncharacterized protein n=1 Tax=Seminavis robusta TaxID=568900 RepID=A0A9N8HH76_9STRA|nr:expressed unknown protein [Seminavis robusta]|eukprot:Sro689_g187490.1 n/a (763) ;mRNA; f:57-2437